MSTITAGTARKPLYKSLFVQVVVALILGIVLGVMTPEFAIGLKFFSDMFLKLITMIVAPIVFCVVVHGIAGAGDLKKVGRVGVKALVYFEVMTTVALAVGLALGFLIGPGHGMNVNPATLDAKALSNFTSNAHQLQGGGIGGFVLNIIPTTSFDALARNDVLQVLFFAIIFGVSLALVGEPGRKVSEMVDAVSTVLFRAMGLIVRLAPLGVLGAVAYTVGRYGIGSLEQLASLVVVYYVALAFFVLVVLGGIMWFAGLNIFRFLSYMREELTIVLATASSDAVLPQIMRKLTAMGVKAVGRRAGGADGLFVQPRCVLDLPDAGGGVHRPGHQHAAVDRRSAAGPGDLAGDLEGCARRARLGHRDPGGDVERGAQHPGDRPGAGAVGGLVHRHGPGTRQPDRQLRGHGGDRGVGKGHRPGDGKAGIGRRNGTVAGGARRMRKPDAPSAAGRPAGRRPVVRWPGLKTPS